MSLSAGTLSLLSNRCFSYCMRLSLSRYMLISSPCVILLSFLIDVPGYVDPLCTNLLSMPTDACDMSLLFVRVYSICQQMSLLSTVYGFTLTANRCLFYQDTFYHTDSRRLSSLYEFTPHANRCLSSLYHFTLSDKRCLSSLDQFTLRSNRCLSSWYELTLTVNRCLLFLLTNVSCSC